MMVVMALMVLALRPAVAFGPDRAGDPKEGEPAGRHDDPPEYQFSGTNFNFSMSRLAPPSDDADQKRTDTADEQQEKQQQNRPGFFQRLLRSLFWN
jgi:hypothetical protein